MKSKAILRRFCILAGSSMMAVPFVHATIISWDGDTSVTWTDAANWGGTAPADSLLTDIANFNLATYGGNPVYAPTVGTVSINGITIGSSNGAMTLTTTNLSIGDGGLSVANGAGALTVNGIVTIGAVQTWTNNDDDIAAFNGNLAFSNKLTLAGGNFLFTGTNTGTGGIDLSGGNLIARAAGSFGPNTNTLFFKGGNLELRQAAGATASTTYTGLLNAVTSGGTITINRTDNGSVSTTHTAGTLAIGANTLAVVAGSGLNTNVQYGLTLGSTTLSGNATFDVANNGSGYGVLTLGALSQTGGTWSLTKKGAGILTLNGATNTMTGGFKVEAGTLRFSNQFSGAGNLVTLGVAGDASFGTLDINGGTRDIHSLATAGTAANQIIGNGSTSTNSTLNYNGASTSDFGGMIQNTVVNGNRALALTLNNASANFTLSGTTSNTYTNGTTVTAGTLVLNKSGTANAIGTHATASSSSLTINGGEVQYHSSAGTNQIGDTAIVTVSGGTFNMNSISDTLGGLVYNSGTISNVASPLILANNGSGTLSMRNTTIDFDIAFSNTAVNTNGLSFDATNNGTATISGGINMNNTATTGIQRLFTVNDGTAAVDMEISGVISATTSTLLQKNGTGTLLLSGANTYDGGTRIFGGTLQISTINSVGGAASNLGIASNATNGTIRIDNGGKLVYTGVAATTDRILAPAAPGSGTGATTVDQSGTGLLKFTNFGATSGGGNNILTLQGSTSGTGEISGIINNATVTRLTGITKAGTGTWILSGANTYTLDTNVQGGTLLLNGTHISTTAGTDYIVSNSGSTLGGTGRIAINGNVSVGSTAILAPGASIGTLTLDGVNTTAAVLTMATGSLFSFELDGSGGTPDQLAFWNYLGGDMVLNDNAINLSLLGTQAAGTYTVDIFRFFSNAGTTVTTHAFSSGLTIGTLGAGIDSASIDWNGTGDNNQSIALTYTVIPEPHVALLGGLGVLLLLRRRRH